MILRSRFLAIAAVTMAILVALFAAGTLSPSIGPQSTSLTETSLIQTAMMISSPAFENGERIPPKYTCDGENISPPLSWGAAPDGTRTYALVVDDLDAPSGVFTHWLIFNIPATETSLRENVPARATLSNGAIQGSNSFGKTGYGGPCPPAGTHRYVFHLYSLDTELSLPPSATRQDLLKAIEGHVLAEAELIGLYSRG